MAAPTQINPYTNPFHIGNSDNPGNVLVSHLLTGEDNYASRSRLMKIALHAKNKFGFLDGTIPVPDKGDPLYQSWFQNNSIVSSWIFSSICKDIIPNIIYSSTAAEMWPVLHDQYHQPNGPRVFQLRRDLVTCTQRELYVRLYFSKIQALSKELQEFQPASNCVCRGCRCKKNMQKEHIHAFLMGLNDGFSSLHGQILLKDPFPNINQVYAMVLQEAKQKEVGNHHPPTSIALANAVKTNMPKIKPSTRKERPLCTHCGMLGHTMEKCFKLHGNPPGYRKNKPADQEANAHHVADDRNTMTATQYPQIINFLQQQMPNVVATDTPPEDPSHVGL